MSAQRSQTSGVRGRRSVTSHSNNPKKFYSVPTLRLSRESTRKTSRWRTCFRARVLLAHCVSLRDLRLSTHTMRGEKRVFFIQGFPQTDLSDTIYTLPSLGCNACRHLIGPLIRLQRMPAPHWTAHSARVIDALSLARLSSMTLKDFLTSWKSRTTLVFAGVGLRCRQK